MHLLTTHNTKTLKGEKMGFRTAILYLAPARESGVVNVCKHSTEECREFCLYRSGNSMRFPKINEARIRKTKFMVEMPEDFERLLNKDIASLIKNCQKNKLIPCVRLNGTSDLYHGIFARVIAEWHHKGVIFYDYTKDLKRALAWRANQMPAGYHLTYSHANGKLTHTITALNSGVNVAMVFDTKRNQPLPKEWNGFDVIDGDTHDLRFLNSPSTPDELTDYDIGYVIGLRAKGVAQKVKGTPKGFIVNSK